MTEYLSKKAVLEWLDERRYKSPWIESFRDRLESGAFDAPEMEHINAYWAREGLIKHQEAEVQRLREALERIAAVDVFDWSDETFQDCVDIAREALSTTSEPTVAERVMEIECPCCGCQISIKHKSPGINAPEKEGWA